MLDTVYGGLMLLYLAVGLLFLAAGLWVSPALNRWARVLFAAGLAAHSAALLGRWWQSYHLALGHTPLAHFSEKLRLVILQAPMSNFYESLVFFAWCLPFLAILTFRRYLRDYLGTVVTIAACLLLAYASLGGVDSRIKPQLLFKAGIRGLMRRGQPHQTPDAGLEKQLAPVSRAHLLSGIRGLYPGVRGGHPLSG